MTSTASSAPPAVRQAGAWQATLILAASCMPVLGSVLITPVLPQMSQHFASASGATILVPLLATMPSLMIAVFAPFVGGIVDRVGRKKLLLGALFAYSVMGLVPALLDNLGVILLSRLLLGVCESVIITVCTTLIVDYFLDKHRRNRYLGLQNVFASIAGTVFVAVAGALGSVGWHVPFWIYVLGAVIGIPMMVSLWEPKHTEAGAIVGSPRVRFPLRRIGWPLLVTAFGGLTFITLIVHLSYLIVATGVSATDGAAIGGISALSAACVAIGGLAFAKLSRMQTARLIPLCFALQATGMLLIWALPGLLWITVGACITSLGSGLLPPALVTWIVGPTSFAVRGRVTGLFIGSQCLGQFLGPVVLAVLSAASGSLNSAVGCVGVAAALVGAIVYFVSRRSFGQPAEAAPNEELYVRGAAATTKEHEE